MKKPARKLPETADARYDWSNARRGRWAGNLQTPQVAFIRPELWEHFGSSGAINDALAALIKLGEFAAPRRRRAG
jgi:hypothetical protein